MNKQELDIAWKEAMNCNQYENKETDTEYRITIDEETKTVTVAFRGSTSKLDWKQNFTFWKKPYRNMKKLFFVHSGLFNKYKSVGDTIFDKISPHLTPDWKLRAYGFSQGATLATFFHEDAVFRFPDLDIISYAIAPAKGFTLWNWKFLKTRFTTLYDIVNVNDLIPRIPFWWMGFRHYGNKIKLGKRKLIVFPWNIEKEHMNYPDLF